MSGGNGQSPGAIARAELFSNVDELMEWKKTFDLKQRQMIEWQKKVMDSLMELNESMKTTLEGCNVLVQTDTELGNRIDIVNKRLRRIEEAVARLNPR